MSVGHVTADVSPQLALYKTDEDHTPYDHTPYDHTPYDNTPYDHTPHDHTPHERHKTYTMQAKLKQAALMSTNKLRLEALANQRAILDKRKAAFEAEVLKILDAMDHPDDPKSILLTIADSEFNVHLDVALAAAEAITALVG